MRRSRHGQRDAGARALERWAARLGWAGLSLGLAGYALAGERREALYSV